jgi:outer membrane protein TolC
MATAKAKLKQAKENLAKMMGKPRGVTRPPPKRPTKRKEG